MFISIVDVDTTATDRPSALKHLDAERDEIRAMPGNIAFWHVRRRLRDDMPLPPIPPYPPLISRSTSRWT